MKTAIMQPYFLPYIGYFQLIAAVDRFVVYDTIQYTKKGWINRNQMLRGGQAVLFTLPLQKASDFLDVRDRQVAESFDPSTLCAQIAGTYRKAPEFTRTFPIIESLLHYRGANLFDFVHNALFRCCDYLGIATPIQVSSDVEGGAAVLRGVDRVIDICHRTGASTYVNPPGGRTLYSSEYFRAHGLELKFMQPTLPTYTQFGSDFVQSLSILDVMMFNAPSIIRSTMLETVKLVD
jgi:WbqC-like protein family